MTKSEKRERDIRQNPKAVRYPDLDALLRAYGFVGKGRGGSHVTYRHPLVPEARCTVAVPHGGKQFVTG